jgi:hypothetical protein
MKSREKMVSTPKGLKRNALEVTAFGRNGNCMDVKLD